MIDRSPGKGSPRYRAILQAVLLSIASVALGGTTGFVGFVMFLEWSRGGDGAWPAFLGGQAPGADLGALAPDAIYEMDEDAVVYWTARADSEGELLDRRRRYRIVSEPLPARFWSITLYDAQGRLLPNAWERYSFTSLDVASEPDGSFAIEISPEIQPGVVNSIPSGAGPGDGTHFLAYLRLYDPDRDPDMLAFPVVERLPD